MNIPMNHTGSYIHFGDPGNYLFQSDLPFDRDRDVKLQVDIITVG